MKTILITDTHYGVKNNSNTWCNYQLKFIDDTIIPLIQQLSKNDDVRVIHCGDVFDSRAAYSLLIANRVVTKYREIASLCPIYIVAGNHDFYSPISDDYCTIPLLFRDIENIQYYIQNIETSNYNELFVPYYTFLDKDALKTAIQTHHPKAIYTHADLDHLPDEEYKQILQGVSVISGHIHTPNFKDNFFTLGSTYALTFADTNSPRGLYVVDTDDYANMKFIENTSSIKFWRLYDNQIFNYNFTIGTDDYIEIYINKKFLIEDEFIKKLKDLSTKYRNIKVIPNDVESSEGNAEVNFDTYNIDEQCRKCIPDYLQEKFNTVIANTKDI